MNIGSISVQPIQKLSYKDREKNKQEAQEKIIQFAFEKLIKEKYSDINLINGENIIRSH